MSAHERISALDTARSYIDRGWNPVPVGHMAKEPSAGPGWDKILINHSNVAQYFNGHAHNIGVQMGKASGGLSDVDLDCPEAIATAPFLLPKTGAIFGRQSARHAHWLYNTTLAETEDNATLQFLDSVPHATAKGKKAMLVELRIGGGGKGAQTVFPGSIHETGEIVKWEEAGQPSEAGGAELKKMVALIAVGAILVRYWPGMGARHNAALAIGGFLARAGYKPEWIKYFVEQVARAAGCNNVADKKNAAYESATNTLAGKKTFGLPKIKELFGEHVAKKVAGWLGYDGGGAEGGDAAEMAEDDAIQIKDGDLHLLATKTEQLLIAAGVPLYQRGDTLVRPIVETVDATRGRTTKVAQLRILDVVYLRDLMGRHVCWGKYNERKKKSLKTNPPLEIAATVLARVGDWSFPAIAGVISTPTMSPDGSLLTEQGYDPATRLLLVEPPPLPAIPDRPTKQEALDALKLLEDLLKGFPFVDEVGRAVSLSAIITPVVRGAFSVTPMHASRAPTPGSGKSFLWDVGAAISSGQPMPVMSAGANTEETEKRLGAALLAGQPLISIDNISGELGGDALCQIIERPVVEIRVLGRSERVRIEARGTSMFATGNNFVVVGDVCRRVIMVSLDAGVERPELRQFEFDPVTLVLADRGKYIAAALTICRAYFVAGRPKPAPKLASFEGWSDTVRSALIWLGKEDPVKSMEIAREEDPERIELIEMMQAWERVIGSGSKNRVKLSDVLLKGAAMVKDGLVGQLEPTHADLYAALEGVAFRATGKRGLKPDPRMLGLWLRQFKGRVVDGKRFACQSNQKGGSEWWVESVAQGGGV
jgi:hypothetical protein